jgi:alpha-tubulin suppressor-like RCC1 family protein
MHFYLRCSILSLCFLALACRESTSPGSGRLRFTSIVTGGDFTCGLATDSLSYCWGFTPHLGFPADGYLSLVSPTATAGATRFASLAAGGTKACGRTSAGVTYCWGSNTLGDGTDEPDYLPRAIGGQLQFRSIAIGAFIACALTDDGTAYCWGVNDYGQVGNGTPSLVELNPTPVAGGAVRFKSVVFGAIHTCGIGTDDFTYCWGNNTLGQLGVPGTNDSCGFDHSPQCALTPVRVSDTLRFTTLSAGALFTCGLAAGGKAFCWGTGDSGELGTAHRTAATPQAVGTDLRFVSLVAGHEFNCGLTGLGEAYCWGNNAWAQLGTTQPHGCGFTPAPQCSPLPVPVMGDLRFRIITANGFHACGLTVDSLAYCWGSGRYGQLGDGTVDHNSYVPVRVINQRDPRP